MTQRSSTKSERETEEVYEPSRATRLYVVWKKLRRSELAVFGFGIVLFVVILAIFAPLIAPDPTWMGPSLRSPSMTYLFGTDAQGRNLFSLVIHGARISLYVGIATVALELLIGMTIGMVAGYFGGIIDELLMRITDVILTLPELPLLIVAVAFFDVRSIHVIVLVMGLVGWPFIARVTRGEFLSLRESTYVEAARSIGASNRRIIFSHILPNIFSTIIVLATMDIPWYIFYEATLTFLGFGDPLSFSWGVLLEKGYLYFIGAGKPGYWWLITIPGIALFFTSLGFNLFGDGLRDALDVKTSGR
jgi:ABC-type dipeptide/oligopeptide/nickel transport system permease subunit